MVVGVGPADGGDALAGLAEGSEGVGARAGGRSDVAGHRLEVQAELADVIRDLGDGVGAGACGGGGVSARVAGVPDVAGVGGDASPAGGGGHDAADTEAGGTVASARATGGGALGAGEAGAVGGGGGGGGAAEVGELDDGEEGEDAAGPGGVCLLHRGRGLAQHQQQENERLEIHTYIRCYLIQLVEKKKNL